MLRLLTPLLLAGALCVSADEAAETMAATSSDMLRVTLDQAKIARLPPGTVTLVIGNPMIADVTMLKGGGGMVVTGKGFGQTNLIAIDASGNIIDEKQIRVEPGETTLIVQRGNERASYSCTPRCMPTVQLGDDPKFFADVGGQIQQHNGFAQGGTPAGK